MGGDMNSITAPTNAENRYMHIDALRAFAVMLVVVAHAGIGHIVPGGSGVTIFFAISGFIITHLLIKERSRSGGFSVGSFYRRRFIKIAPPFVVIIAIPTLLYSIWGNIDWIAFGAQIFFAYNWIKYQGHYDVLPGSEVVWSLAIEEQFYIAFAVLWLLAVGSKHWRSWLVLISLLAIIYSTSMRFLLASDGMAERIYYGSDTRLDGIAWGVGAAALYHFWLERSYGKGWLPRLITSPWAFWVAISVYLASLIIRDDWFRETLRYSFQAIATCVVILFGMWPGRGQVRKLFFKISAFKVVNLIGAASYSIYLVHLMVDAVLRPYVESVPLGMRVVLLTLVGTGVGVLAYVLVEVPAHKIGKRIAGRSSNTPPVPASLSR